VKKTRILDTLKKLFQGMRSRPTVYVHTIIRRKSSQPFPITKPPVNPSSHRLIHPLLIPHTGKLVLLDGTAFKKMDMLYNKYHGQSKRYNWHLANVLITTVIILSA